MKINRHHIIQKSAGGTDNINNIVDMEVFRHNGLHYLFPHSNNHPILQYQYLFELTKKVLMNDVKYEIQTLLDLVENEGMYAYKKGLY